MEILPWFIHIYRHYQHGMNHHQNHRQLEDVALLLLHASWTGRAAVGTTTLPRGRRANAARHLSGVPLVGADVPLKLLNIGKSPRVMGILAPFLLRTCRVWYIIIECFVFGWWISGRTAIFCSGESWRNMGLHCSPSLKEGKWKDLAEIRKSSLLLILSLRYFLNWGYPTMDDLKF